MVYMNIEQLKKLLKDSNITFDEKILSNIIHSKDNIKNITNLTEFIKKSMLMGKDYSIHLLADKYSDNLVIAFFIRRNDKDIKIPKILCNVDITPAELIGLPKIFDLHKDYKIKRDKVILCNTEQLSWRYWDTAITEDKLALFVSGYIEVIDKESLVKYMLRHLGLELTKEKQFINTSTFDSSILRYTLYIVYHNIENRRLKEDIRREFELIESMRKTWDTYSDKSILKTGRLNEINAYRKLLDNILENTGLGG